MDDALAVISASTDNIDIMHRVIEQAAAEQGTDVDQLKPEAWLDAFYAQRKGSGKNPNANNAAGNRREPLSQSA
jgi:type IV secretion system protein VirB4